MKTLSHTMGVHYNRVAEQEKMYTGLWSWSIVTTHSKASQICHANV